MPLALRNHGGGCCGMRHIVGFYGPVAVVKEQLERLMAQVPQGHTSCRVIECVLTQAQRKTHGKTLEDAGFKIVTRFRNANTGATLNVYHFCLYPVAEQKAKEPAIKG